MSIQQLETARESLKNFTPGTTFGLENRPSLNFMAQGFGAVVLDTAKNLLRENLAAPFVTGYLISDAESRLKQSPYMSMANFTVRTPEGVTGPMLPYLVVLDAALDDLMTVRKRLLDPLKMWLGKAIANPGHIEKIWLDNSISFVDVDSHIAALAEHYSDRVGDDISFAPLSKVYPKLSDFVESGKMVEDISKESARVLGDDVAKITEDISVLVKKFTAENDKSDFASRAPAASIAKLSECLYQAGREVELLSVVLFQTRIACVAYEESVKKINDNLR